MPTGFLRHPLARLIRLDKPVGFLLLLWPTLVALWLAGDGWPGWHLFAVMVLGTFCMRSAGCAINDYADRHLDGQVERTADRPLVQSELRPGTALLTALLLTLLAGILVLSTRWMTVMLALAGLPIAALYPYVKRFGNYPQLVLGLAFAWGVPVGWSAVTGSLSGPAVMLFIGSWFWIVLYDTQYAMRDRADDLKAGVGSTAIGFGPHDRLAIVLCQAAALACWWQAGRWLEAGLAWYLALGMVGLVFIWQAWIIRDRDPRACFAAFNLNALAGALLFAGALADTWQGLPGLLD